MLFAFMMQKRCCLLLVDVIVYDCMLLIVNLLCE